MKIIFAVCVATLGMIVLYGWIDHTIEPYSKWDLAAYMRMAEAAPGVAGEVAKPFAYRIMGPWLAGMVPGSVGEGFRMLSLVASLVLPFQFLALLRERGIVFPWAGLATLFFVCNRYLFGFTVWNGFQLNDILSLNLLLISLSAMWRRSWTLFAISLAVGLLARETALLLIPVLGLWLWEEKAEARTWIPAAVACVPGLLVFIGLRLWIPAQGGRDLAEAFAAHAPKMLSVEIPARLFFNAFLPFAVLPVIFWRETLTFARENKHLVLFLLLVAASTLFGTNNERLMAPGFVVVYFLIARILQKVTLGYGATSILILAAFANSFHHLYGRFPLPDRTWTLWVTAITTVAVAGWSCKIQLGGQRISKHVT